MSKPVLWKWSWQETQVTMATWWMLCSRKEAREKESRIVSWCLGLSHIFKHGCDSASGPTAECMNAGASLPVAASSFLFWKLCQFPQRLTDLTLWTRCPGNLHSDRLRLGCYEPPTPVYAQIFIMETWVGWMNARAHTHTHARTIVCTTQLTTTDAGFRTQRY